MPQSHKDYLYAFLLESTKLSRVIDVVHERMTSGDPSVLLQDRFEVFFPENRADEINSLEDVLALENSKKKKITRLVVDCTGNATDNVEYSVKIDYGALSLPHGSPPGTAPRKMISVTARGPSSSWVGSALSEVEEQIERTQQRHIPPIVALASILLVMLIVLLFQVGIVINPNPSRAMWLSDADLDRVQKIVAQNRPVTDEESREITTMQLRNLLEAQRPTQPPPKIPRRFYLFALPTLVVFVCGIFLVRTYPSAVFLWGDEVERNNNLIQRRRVLWGVIIGIMVIGVFSKLLYEGIASWVPGS